jgi:molecular chaperone DnaK (HSP70)
MSPKVDPIVGIDLGTSNSCVAVVDGTGLPRVLADPQGRKVIPSVVAFHPNGQVLVGQEAKQRRVIDPKNTVFSVKRFMGRRFSSREVTESVARSSFKIEQGEAEQPVIATRAGRFTVPEVSAIVLDHMRRIADSSLGVETRRAVITVPANFIDAQRSATAMAGEIAELVVVRVLNEPTAAALAYGHGKQLRQTVAVYDFGGGTFDITILALRDQIYEVLATAGDTFLGGDDIDNRLVDVMTQSFLQQHRIDLRTDELAVQRLRAVAEQVKCELSVKPKALVTIEEIAIGDGGRAIDLQLALTRDELVARTKDIVDRSFPVCDEAMRLAGLSNTQIDEVVLVGGTTRIPYLREQVARYFGKLARTDVNPDEAVALGAALQGAALSAVLDRAGGKRGTTQTSIAPPPQRPVTLDLEDDDVTNVHDDEPSALPPASRSEVSQLARIATKKVAVVRPPRPGIQEISSFTDDEDSRIQTTERSFSPPPVVARPVLLDVTPRGLAVGTIGGYCDEIVRRNAQIPIEQTRAFTTAQDGQTSVKIRVCQGESRRFDENALLGTLVLDGLPAKPRGALRIAVTFEINTDGILEVSAKDEATGHAQTARIELLGVQSGESVEAARERLRELRGG